MRDIEFHRRVAELLSEGRPFATGLLISSEGHAPQTPGVAMIVHPDGSIEFTIGGGRFEAMVIHDALALLEEESADCVQKSYELTKKNLGMYCAGRATVLLMAHHPADRLVIFGGGHVGQALGRVATATELFHVTVVDDRKAFATTEAHPTVHEVIHTDPSYERDLPRLDPGTWVVVVTRCHDVDKDLIRKLAPMDVAYLGMIGSRAKVDRMWLELEQEGVPREALDAIHAPIGLPIGGKSPGEIAISILGEIIDARHRKHHPEKRHPADREGVPASATHEDV